MMRALISLVAAAVLAGAPSASAQGGGADSLWIQLFNKRDTRLLNDWEIKIRGEPLNSDSRNTFRWAVVGSDTVLEVNYSNYSDGFGGDAGPFGHIAYKLRTFSHYLLRVEYMFFGEQVAGGPAWALQNSGMMLHSQPLATMGLNQNFPVSMEAQLLGPGNRGAGCANADMNVCTPGTALRTSPDGNVVTTHCLCAASGTRGNGWREVSVLMLGDSIARHYVGSQLVFTYHTPVLYAGAVSGHTITLTNGAPLSSGYIVLQSESHPVRFRKVEVLNLEGCMTPGDAAFRSYFVKHDATACTRERR